MRERSLGRHAWWVRFALAGCVLNPTAGAAQSPGSTSLTLNDAMQLALKNFPAIKESRARAQAAAEGGGVARTAYLPKLDMIWQENRATTNNVFGLLLPQAVVPSMSGPVLGTRSLGTGVLGRGAGVPLSW